MPKSSSITISRKVAAGGLAGSLTIILVWVLNTAIGVDVPPEVASAFTTILTFGTGFIVNP